MSVTVRMMCSPLAPGEASKSNQGSRLNGLSLKGRSAQIVNGKLMLVEATPTRRRNGDDEEDAIDNSNDLSYVEGAPDDEEEENDEEDTAVASTSRLSTPSSTSKARPKAVRRQTRYFCTWEGCSKSYAKPVRLTEHMRSHTGERPFKCTHEGCNASYLRDTHLVAHMRTHLDEKDKPFTCEEEECGKKFWTNQHLNRHVKLVHEQDNGAYKCDECDAAFNKHNKLREHVAKDHMPEGTKPFICPEEGCGKSFRTGSKLRTHSKIHDKNRYVCMHVSHLAQTQGTSSDESNHIRHSESNDDDDDDEEEEEGQSSGSCFPKFATWSALQEHNKLEHPPTCPHPECGGRTFKSNKKMRKHCIKVHLDVVGQSETETGTGEDADAQTNDEAVDEVAQAQAPAEDSFLGAQPDQTRQTAAPKETITIQNEAALEASQEQYSFGGRARKRKSLETSIQLIPTQPITLHDFGGEDDYAEDPGARPEQGMVASSKRVRFK